MPPVGPELPPHLLAKRKRQAEEAESASVDRPSRTASKSPSPGSSDKRRRVVGPSLPPAPLDEKPLESPNRDEESSSDDEIGPALPPPSGSKPNYGDQNNSTSVFDRSWDPDPIKKPQREEWMLIPPKQEDWSSRVDPTKLKNRKFNSGKGAKAPAQKSGDDHTIWTETPEQKRKRLEDEVMGVSKPATMGPGPGPIRRDDAESEETERRIREYNEKNRGKSLYDEHKKHVPKDAEDDPSKRAFDKEKDIRGGQKIGFTQKKEMLNRAADFGSRFAKGSFL
ncbi:MAG: hypothetical protein M1819_002888 [Sarea resinae]|nr:MAG: hypothetical protein M1819_002888 [Sarea resinae]